MTQLSAPNMSPPIPVRLKGGRRAYLFLPDDLTLEEADHIHQYLKLQVEPETADIPRNITYAYELGI